MLSLSCYFSRILFLLPFLVALPGQAVASSPLTVLEELPKEKKLMLANGTGLVFITLWGVANWDYGQKHPTTSSEGWFGHATKEGGADKLGHFHMAYTLSRGLTALYESWGYEADRAALYGSFSACGLTGFMELGDSFSDFGFSHEDMLMNVLGSGVGYLASVSPAFSEKVDFRVEYWPEFDQTDIFTDYEHMRFLTALKFSGFDWGMRSPFLKYLELHLGYYARGYDQESAVRERNLYLGLGINLSRVFEQLGQHKAASVFHYYQLPYTELRLDRDLE